MIYKKHVIFKYFEPKKKMRLQIKEHVHTLMKPFHEHSIQLDGLCGGSSSQPISHRSPSSSTCSDVFNNDNL